MKFNIKYFNKYEEEESPDSLVHRYWVTELGKNDKENYFNILYELRKTLKDLKGFPDEIELHIRQLGEAKACLTPNKTMAIDTNYIAGDYHNVWEVFYSICHELGHYQQVNENKLILEADGFYWKKEYFEYELVNMLEPNEYNYLPWEMDADKKASKFMKQLFPEYFKLMKQSTEQV